MAARGVSRSTHDVDLLATRQDVLDPAIWADLKQQHADVEVEIRTGDDDDPLLGLVKISRRVESPVDIVVGRGAWQAEVIQRATPLRVGNSELPVVDAADLILLKLYAGGPQDCWDIEQLLALRPVTLAETVETRLPALPTRSRSLWHRIRGDQHPCHRPLS